MPNWCSTTYYVIGEKENLKDLKDTLDKIAFEHKGTVWMGDLLKSRGIDPEKQGIYCRGWVEDYNYYEDSSNQLEMYIDYAWDEIPDMRYFIEEEFKVKIYYYAEESGMGIYRSNDIEQQYFTMDYIIDSDDGIEYYSTDDAIDWVKDFFDIPQNEKITEEQMLQLIEDYTIKDLDYELRIEKVLYVNDD